MRINGINKHAKSKISKRPLSEKVSDGWKLHEHAVKCLEVALPVKTTCEY